MHHSTSAHAPSRRRFLQTTLAAGAAASVAALAPARLLAADGEKRAEGEPPYKISLAQWSLHKTIFAGKLDHLDFAKTAKEEFGIEGVEYVNQFFKDKATDTQYLGEMKQRAADHGVTSLLIMVDGEGQLGATEAADRQQTVDNHKKWVEAAKFLGCHSVRVNAASSGTYEEQQKRAADGLRMLSEFAKPLGLNVIVENHGGLSSNGQWLAGTIEMVGMDNCGTLPDFGNFVINRKTGERYDNYKGVDELMPYAKAVSAKTYAFDENGNETSLDYPRLMDIVLKHGYHGWVGIEWEGAKPDEFEGIRLSKALLERIAAKV
ncbi:sugar phosphate isomerase/epimerase family protein [Candidatus Laterigemmans baculatus]|uniref:sugar phosphate isomerase/epimerase family protein n=1 Tax=Candidatus Laterigemmans baculatus TaxID=2770505 RepID=UPI0013D95351|nr:sugar phosphate isomerase/epimerase family protein [Candidatus Laterigemmans baculatus]